MININKIKMYTNKTSLTYDSSRYKIFINFYSQICFLKVRYWGDRRISEGCYVNIERFKEYVNDFNK